MLRHRLVLWVSTLLVVGACGGSADDTTTTVVESTTTTTAAPTHDGDYRGDHDHGGGA